MAAKSGILDAIGETGLLLADKIRDGLAANDRIKTRLTELQDLIARHRSDRAASAVVPGASRLRRELVDDLALMLEPLRHAPKGSGPAERVDAYIARLRRHADAAASAPPDELTDADITAITGLGDEAADSLHRLVMDLHRELNGMLAALPSESVDGAATTGLLPSDRKLVRAFMKGLSATAALKFDHPGLATTAARYDEALSIQNDLGTTDAHVVVFRIEARAVAVTYSDVHRQRVRFFEHMLAPFALDWQSGPAAADGSYEVAVGRLQAADESGLQAFLEFAASRLVFLIDWNRARKQLQQFVSKEDAVALLAEAAADNVGHRGFLQAGGAQLIYSALERAARDRISFGVRLDETIGHDEAVSLLRAVLRIASTALLGGRSARLIQDQVQAELVARTRSAEERLLEATADHAMLVAAIAERVRHTLARAAGAGAVSEAARGAELAHAWEARADALLRRTRDDFRATADPRLIDRVLVEADRAGDCLEDVCFLLTLMSPGPADAARALLPLADIAAEAVKEYVRALACTRAFAESHNRTDMNDSLVAVDRIIELEHRADAAERTARVAVLDRCADARNLTSLLDAGRGFERATDALARSASALSSYMLSDCGARR